MEGAVGPRILSEVGLENACAGDFPGRSEDTRLNSSHSGQSRMPSSA